MLIVDSHVHIWGTGQPSPAHWQRPALSAEELMREMDAAGVHAAVIQPPAWDPTSNEVATEAARCYPDRYAVLGSFELDRPDSHSMVRILKRRAGMRGFRFTFVKSHQLNWPIDGTLDWLWAEAEREGMPIALTANTFLPKVGEIAERHPGLRLLIDHLGMRLRAVDDEAFASMPALLALAKYPNIAVKASAAPSYSSEAYPFKNIHAHLRAIFDAFGPQRMFWGTDVTRMPCSWRQCVTLFTEELPWLSGHDKELVMGQALCKWIGWDLNPQMGLSR